MSSRLSLQDLQNLESRLRDFGQKVGTTQAFDFLIRDYNMPPTLKTSIDNCLNPQTRQAVQLQPRYRTAFDILWKKRCPIIYPVENLIQLPWDPSSLKQSYGKQQCLVIECQDTSKQTKSRLQSFLDKMESTEGTLLKVKVLDGFLYGILDH